MDFILLCIIVIAVLMLVKSVHLKAPRLVKSESVEADLRPCHRCYSQPTLHCSHSDSTTTYLLCSCGYTVSVSGAPVPSNLERLYKTWNEVQSEYRHILSENHSDEFYI